MRYAGMDINQRQIPINQKSIYYANSSVDIEIDIQKSMKSVDVLPHQVKQIEIQPRQDQANTKM